MTFYVSNFEALRNAAKCFEDSAQDEPLILIFQTPGGILHRFIITNFGIEKQDCDGRGERL